MTQQHTPGPWRLMLPDDTRVVDSHNNHIASAFGDYDVAWGWESVEANARLIAAAPEMLEALEGVYARCCGEYPDHPETLAVAAAIAKAKGTNQNV